MSAANLVIIPCYNEKENIRRLIETLLSLYENIEILIVDDNSPDGTADEVRNAFDQVDRVHLMVRDKKDGRGGAVLDGIAWALEEKTYDRIVEMDADFSHEPKELSALLEASSNADVIIGSRYLLESSIQNWPLRRRIFSKIANLYARTLLRIPISDYTNGYRLYSKKAAASIERNAIKSKGYIVLSAIAYQLHRSGFTFAEVPTVFVNRDRGVSNLSISELWDAFSGIIKIRLK